MSTPNDQDQKSNPNIQQFGATSGNGHGRQGVGEAFLMSMIRQIARSIGQALVRAVLGGRR